MGLKSYSKAHYSLVKSPFLDSVWNPSLLSCAVKSRILSAPLSPDLVLPISETMSHQELACTYAALILSDDGIAITGDKIATLVKAANLNVESFWPSLFAKLAEKRSIEDLILNVGAGGGGGGAPVAAAASSGGGGGGGAAAAPPPPEEKKEEPKEESDDDMGFSLFD